MNTVLWILQILLAVAFLAAGAMRLAQSREKLAAQTPWANDFTDGQVKGAGALEVLGALGLVLPAVTGIARFLVRWPRAGSAC